MTTSALPANIYRCVQEVHIISLSSLGKESYKVVALRSHPQYTIGKLRDRGIPEFYDYDIALVKLDKKVKFSSSAR